MSWVSKNLFDHVTYTVRRGHLKGLRRTGGLGWLPEWLARDTPTMETRFLTSRELNGKVVYDIGAFHGIWTMFFALGAGFVVCFEPNSRNRARLIQNLKLNGFSNVVIRDCGLGSEATEATMVWSDLTPGGASVSDTEMAGSISATPGALRENIRISTLDSEIEEQNLPRPDFIKMDVEGYELKALLGGRELLCAYHPELFIEMHGDTMRGKEENARAVIELLESYGYRGIRHVELDTPLSVANAAAAAQGHIYCPRIPN